MAVVFISYRTADAKKASRLAEEIRSRGHEVWIDQTRIGLGDSIVGRMEEGLADAAYLVVCFSSVGIKSPWMSREWMSGLARQLQGARVKLLPVKFKDGEPPAILADIKYADLAQDWDQGVDQLCNSIC
jgi:hypothetical protein